MTPDVIDIPDTAADLVPIPAEVGTFTPVSALVRPAGTPGDVAEAFTEYAAVCERVLDDSDYQNIGGKRYRTKSAWKKLSLAYGVDTALVSEVTERHDNGGLARVHTTVRATAPNGRFADGVGSCDAGERKFAHPEHDVRATAYTRAANRAASDLFGLGEVSAEEMSGANAFPIATQANMKLLVAAAKEAKEGGTEIGAWPVVLGTPVFDTVKKVPTITDATCLTLLAALRFLTSPAKPTEPAEPMMPHDDKPAMVCRGCGDPITGEGDEELPKIVDGSPYHPACAPM